MKKLANSWITFFILFCFSGCVSFKQNNEKVLMALNKNIKTTQSPSDWADSLSPNGEWKVESSQSGLEPYYIYSIYSPDEHIFPKNTGTNFPIRRILEWSPDSTMIAVRETNDANVLGWMCRANQVTIYHLVGKELRNSVYITKDNECINSSAWSPDSNKLALAFDDRILILDENAQVLEELPLNPNANSILLWSERGLFIAMHPFEDKEGTDEIWWSETGKLDSVKLIYEEKGLLSVVSLSPDRKYLLVPNAPFDEHNHESGIGLEVLELQTGQIIKRIFIPGRISFGFCGAEYYLFNAEGSKGPDHILLFDWKKIDLVDYGPVGFPIGRFKDIDGFLIIKEQNGSYVFDVFKPDE